MIQRVVKLSVHGHDGPWTIVSRTTTGRPTMDPDSGHTAYFDLDDATLMRIPSLREAMTRNGELGRIVQIDHESNGGWRYLTLLVEF